ncbi:hypothetical protein BGW38_002318 [Lunasporangiospora selenospora]|uniref:Endonuclease/exonuclease/phosphatase domain-containing protein n=1 Tax=Lunasporangiospora selenospora TaxID=979761 RepID=A0A9P6G3A8_9FUNG|nr:hypothetical protein BGW38_002318 [Lunasporangiospora selenospora]
MLVSDTTTKIATTAAAGTGVETCAPFLDRYGGVVFVYDWNVAKETIKDYYQRQYPDGWVKVMPFSLRNILHAIKHLDHRLDRYETCDLNGLNTGSTIDLNVSNSSLSSTTSHDSGSGSPGSGRQPIETKKQHQVVFLLTGSMNPDYGVFGLMQKQILDAVKEALPERVHAVNVIGHCMYGCASCSGVEHKVPLYFTRYFNKTLPYTAKDILSIYTNQDKAAPGLAPRSVLVAPSCGSTSMLAQKSLIQLFHRLEQSGRWKFIWKMHPTSLHLENYDTTDPTGQEQVELDNVRFVLANFRVTAEEHACLLPFMEAFDIIITDLHSSVPFIATYFTPKIILSYFNDADYGTPERHQEFMDQLNVFIEPEELEHLLEHLPQPKGDPSFFHSQYGHVDGKEDLRFGNMAGWPLEQFEPTQPLQHRKAMGQIALKWRTIWKNMTQMYPDDVEGANNALGFDGKFPLLQGEDQVAIPKILPHVLPRDRQAAGIELKIMSFNIWNGGQSGGYPLEKTAHAILESGADIVGLQECSSVQDETGKRRYMLPELVKYLPGWYYSDQKHGPNVTGPRNPWGVVSKFPIVNTTELGFGVKIQLNNHRHPEFEPSYHSLPEYEYTEQFTTASPGIPSPGSRSQQRRRSENTRFMYLFNIHLYYFPYQPFQLAKIPYDTQPFLDTAEEAIQSSIAARGAEMKSILREMEIVAEEEKDVPIFMTGDFNEPSHLDWTPLTVLAGIHPLTVKWPMTEWAYKAGLVDLWRAYSHPIGSSLSSPTSPTSPMNPVRWAGQMSDLVSSIDSVTLGDTAKAQSGAGAGARADQHSVGDIQRGSETQLNETEQAVLERPGFSWTVLKPELDPGDHYDRIDYIFGLNRESSPIALKNMAVLIGEEAGRVGEKNDKVSKPWPSDHRAVLATVLM